MVTKQMTRRSEAPRFVPDENWWAALLAEEEKYALSDAASPRHQPPAKPNRPPTPTHSSSRPTRVSIPQDTATPGFSTPRLPAARAIAPKPEAEPQGDDIDWGAVQQLFDCDETVYLYVTGANRGGLLVEGDGLHGFVPVSHLVNVSADASADERETLMQAYLGRDIRAKVIECNEERGRVVFSERAALAESGQRNQIFEALKTGQHVQGTITNITEFGVFVDLGGVEGLIHISELSWGRVQQPADIVAIGQAVQALVLNVDRLHSRVALSMKRLQPNPWETAENRYSPGQLVDATITCVVPFGAFARIEEGLDGLIHLSEMGQGDRVVDPRDLLIEGQAVRVRILHVDSHKQRLGLSLTQVDDGPGD